MESAKFWVTAFLVCYVLLIFKEVLIDEIRDYRKNNINYKKKYDSLKDVYMGRPKKGRR